MHKWHDVRGCRSSEGTHWFQQEQGIEGIEAVPAYLLASNLFFILCDGLLSLGKPHFCFTRWLPVRPCTWGAPKGACKTGGGRRALLLAIRLVLASCQLSVSIAAIPAGPLRSVPSSGSINSSFQFLQESYNQPHYPHSETQATVSQCPLLR